MTQSGRLSSFIFFGEDAFSLAVLQSLVECKLGLQPLAVVMLEPISVSGLRLVNYCVGRGILLIKAKEVRSDEFLDRFEVINFDLLICAHFSRILPIRLFSRARLGALNLHPSLLPLYRGMAPQHWPIVLGDAETGVTVHCIEEGVDTGRIIRQVRIQLNPEIYIHELQKKFLAVYQTIMVEAVDRLINGQEGAVQPAEGVTYFQKIRECDMEITSQMNIKRVYGLIRAFSFPYPGARFQDIRIMKARIVDEVLWLELQQYAQMPGIQSRGAQSYLVLKDGALELTKFRCL